MAKTTTATREQPAANRRQLHNTKQVAFFSSMISFAIGAEHVSN
jgi:hypothetical protein